MVVAVAAANRLLKNYFKNNSNDLMDYSAECIHYLDLVFVHLTAESMNYGMGKIAVCYGE